MPQNEFKPFAIAPGAAVLEQSEYETSQALREGFKKGLARSVEINKAIRQASSIAAAVAEFAAEKSGKDMLDSGEIVILKENFETALRAVSSLLIAEAHGTSDALTASFSPELRELKNGALVHVRARERNRTKTPVFKADETGAKGLVKGNNLSLEEGDIAGAGHWLELQYDEALDKWVLQNPAKGVTPASGVPVGTVEYFALTTPPSGYLKADGAAVGRETYPDLFAAIGTTFGEGDGQTTFNLPDLIDRFAQGSNVPGQKVEAGLPNVTGEISLLRGGKNPECIGAFSSSSAGAISTAAGTDGQNLAVKLNASLSSPIYGASDTVQPPALTLLPCIKAFDAATNPGLIDITELANDVADLSAHKLDKDLNGTPVKYVTETYNDGTNWYRKWSDGWVEQGGSGTTGSTKTFYLPFSDTSYLFIPAFKLGSTGNAWGFTIRSGSFTTTSVYIASGDAGSGSTTSNQNYNWYACGQGAQS